MIIGAGTVWEKPGRGRDDVSLKGSKGLKQNLDPSRVLEDGPRGQVKPQVQSSVFPLQVRRILPSLYLQVPVDEPVGFKVIIVLPKRVN